MLTSQNGDQKIQHILKNVEKIRLHKSKNNTNQSAVRLIYYIASQLRHDTSDHLLHTTAVWALISIFRSSPQIYRDIMLEAGIPTVLFEILNAKILSGASRQYASELCFYLSSNQSYPDSRMPIVPLQNSRSVPPLIDDSEEASIVSSTISSVVQDKFSKKPFIPYKLNEENLANVEQLFSNTSKKRENINSPNPAYPSKFGLSGNYRSFTEQDVADDDSSDGTSVSTTISNSTPRSLPKIMMPKHSNQTSHSSNTFNHVINMDSLTHSHLSPNKSLMKSINSSEVRVPNTSIGMSSSSFGLSELKPKKDILSQFNHDRSAISRKRSQSAVDKESVSDKGNIIRREVLRPTTTNYQSNQKRNFPAGFTSSGFEKSPSVQSSSQILKDDIDSIEDDASQPHENYKIKDLSSQRATETHFRLNRTSHPNAIQRGKVNDNVGNINMLSQRKTMDMIDYRSKSAMTYEEEFQFKIKNFLLRKYEPQDWEADDTRDEESLDHDYYDPDTIASESKQEKYFPSDPLNRSDPYLSGSPQRASLLEDSSTGSTFSRNILSHQLNSYNTPTLGSNSKINTLTDGFTTNTLPPSMTISKDVVARDLYHSMKSVELQNVDRVHSFAAMLDPLALDIAVDEKRMMRFDTTSQMSDSIYEEDEDDGPVTIQDRNEEPFDPNMIQKDNNSITKPSRNFINAEQLVDHRFVKRLFNKKMKVSDMQSFVDRMESLFLLMDEEHTGCVTWEKFSRVILAMAPQNLLRKDVIAFMAAQTDSDQDLVNYQEFIISGKVLILQKVDDVSKNLPIGGWLDRQKVFTGAASTYTWKNHVKWFEARKSTALIWLMKKARSAMGQGEMFINATKFLLHKGKQALAMSFLMQAALLAMDALDKRTNAKKNLLRRCVHARKWMQRVDEAQRFLRYSAVGAINLLNHEDQLDTLKNRTKDEIVQLFYTPKPKQADYGTIFKISQIRRLAFEYLRAKSVKAVHHTALQREAFQYISSYANKIKIQLLRKKDVFNCLLSTALSAIGHCETQDKAYLSLFGIGQRAVLFTKKQSECQYWLKTKAEEKIAHLKKREDTAEYLNKKGRFTLDFANKRDEAVSGLIKIRLRLEKYVIRRNESIMYLQRIPLGIWANEDKVEITHQWLKKRAKQALELEKKKSKAFKRLQFIGARATKTYRAVNIAFADLVQIGQIARFDRFQQVWVPMKQSKVLIRRERAELLKQLESNRSVRKTLSLKQRWKLELKDAFDVISTSLLPSHYPKVTSSEKRTIGRVGFRKLLMNGQLLGDPPDHIDEYFSSVDPASFNFVKFESVWPWFLHHAKKRDRYLVKKQSKNFLFQASDIISVDEWVLLNMFQKYGAEELSSSDSAVYRDAMEKSKQKSKGLFSDDDMEDDDGINEHDVEESSLFSDYTDLQYAHIGELMRFVVKQNLPSKNNSVTDKEVETAKHDTFVSVVGSTDDADMSTVNIKTLDANEAEISK